MLPAEGVGLVGRSGSWRPLAAVERTDETTRPSLANLRGGSPERRRSGGGMGRGLCAGEGIAGAVGTESGWLVESEGEGTMVGSACSKVILPSSFDRYSSR